MSYANANKTEAAMTELDQEKTFESVDWNFLLKALQHFGHGSEIILKKKLVYQNIETQMKVNGHLPQASLVKRGLRQGRPLYVILYAVFAKIFLEHIRQNNFIKGIVIGEKELKTSVFADDTTIYIGSNSSLTHFETQLMHFEKATDIKYNKTICMGIWLGPNKGNQRKPLGSKLNSDTIKILGHTYRHNTIRTGEENWKKICKKIREDIRNWGHLQLSLMGKKILINQIKLWKIWYLSSVENRLTDIIQNIRKDILDFLWNYRKVRVNRNTITLPIEMGGLAIMDIETQCEAI